MKEEKRRGKREREREAKKGKGEKSGKDSSIADGENGGKMGIGGDASVKVRACEKFRRYGTKQEKRGKMTRIGRPGE